MSDQPRGDHGSLIEALLRLKQVSRTGWIDRGVPDAAAESVADHSFGVALLAWTVAADDPSLDRDRVLRLALIHDLAEAVTGDLTPYDPDDVAAHALDEERRAFLDQRHAPSAERRAAKRAAEAEAFAGIVAGLAGPVRAELEQLFREYEQRESPESRFVKQADVLETYLQSLAYARAFPGLPVASFAAEVAEAIKHPLLVAIRDAAAAD